MAFNGKRSITKVTVLLALGTYSFIFCRLERKVGSNPQIIATGQGHSTKLSKWPVRIDHGSLTSKPQYYDTILNKSITVVFSVFYLTFKCLEK